MTRKILIIVAVMVLLLAVGCKSGKKQEAENKDRVYLTLAANPTTGCTWMVTVEDNGVAEYVGSQYVADQAHEGMVGTGGNETFEFKCLKQGDAKVTLKYGHAWAQDEVYDVKEAVIHVNKDKTGTITLK